MTQEVLKLALEYGSFPQGSGVIRALKEALEQTQEPWCMKMNGCKTKCEDCPDEPPQTEQEPVAVYGYCPECGEKGVMRERRLNGNDKCANGHTYPSSKSTPPQPEQEPVADDFFRMIADRNPKPFSSLQHTWVDLTRTQMQDVYFEVLKEHRGGHQMEGQLAFGEALQAKLKERNS